mmetsp:Transcript_12705/g.40142  ORF Transcript_12705/g.40142 Transcript_12705/m.40142 type:complete len:242 (+) Transcript_12705:494-1219(+)
MGTTSSQAADDNRLNRLPVQSSRFATTRTRHVGVRDCSKVRSCTSTRLGRSVTITSADVTPAKYDEAYSERARRSVAFVAYTIVAQLTPDCGDNSMRGIVSAVDGWAGAGSAVSRSEKVDPTPGCDCATIDPPMSVASSLQMKRPRPVPPCECDGASLTCENSTKSLLSPFALMPMPVSRTDRRHDKAVRRLTDSGVSSSDSDTSISPDGVNRSAFATRLSTTWRIRIGSPTMSVGRSGGT